MVGRNDDDVGSTSRQSSKLLDLEKGQTRPLSEFSEDEKELDLSPAQPVLNSEPEKMSSKDRNNLTSGMRHRILKKHWVGHLFGSNVIMDLNLVFPFWYCLFIHHVETQQEMVYTRLSRTRSVLDSSYPRVDEVSWSKGELIDFRVNSLNHSSVCSGLGCQAAFLEYLAFYSLGRCAISTIYLPILYL